MVGFVKLYFPVFLLGAVFGKLIELSGFRVPSSPPRSDPGPSPRDPGDRVCALLTYGGVSLFVVAFAVYPFRRRTVPPERHP
jgi:hypothetical protein